MSQRLHPIAWVAWAAAAGGIVLTLSNPALIVLAALAAATVAMLVARDRGPFALMIKLGLIAMIARTILFALTGHPAGQILFTVPQVRLPVLLGGFTLGGPIAAPVVAHSAIEGARLMALLACAGVFLSVVDATRLMRLVPRFLFEAGLIVAIGIAFVPSLVRTTRDVRDARRLRGERIRGLRALSLAVPVLSATLERAVTVAESMSARGYGRGAFGPGRDRRMHAASIAGVALMSGGAIVATVANAWAGTAAAVAGAALLGWTLARRSAGSVRTRYRRDQVRTHELAVIAIAFASLAVALLMRNAWRYDAYPAVTMPAMPVGGLGVVALIAAPVVVLGLRTRRLQTASAASHPSPDPGPVA